MKKILHLNSIILFAVIFLFSCKSEDDPTNDNPNVYSETVDSTLKSFYPISPSIPFENIYDYSFYRAPLNIYCGLILILQWSPPVESHGIYWHFNNGDGDVLSDNNGFIKAFDSGVKIDSTLSGNWNADGKLSLDYVNNPTGNRGNLAGKGDKYIVFRALDASVPQLKYYGWLRVTISENGRNVIVHSIGFQTIPNTSLRTGEL